VIRNDVAALSVARYIVENPVRAGLVQSPSEYPFVGSEKWALTDIMEAVALRRNWAG
jgi:hypothetical protein